MNENPQPKEPLALFTGSEPNFENARVAVFFARMASKSGLFPELSPEIAIVKMSMAKELGITFYEALSEINFVESRAELSAALMAKLLVRGGRYTYRVATTTKERCDLDFYRILPDGDYELLGRSTWTVEDAADAKLLTKHNWVHYRRKMLFWRAMSDGIDIFCPDAINGHFYVAGEIGDGPPLRPVPGSKIVKLEVVTPPSKDLAATPIAENGPAVAAASTSTASDVRRATKAKDSDEILPQQIRHWNTLHNEYDITPEWHAEHLGERDFYKLNVGEARKVLITLNRHVHTLPKKRKTA